MDFFKSLVEQTLSRTKEATLSMLGINDPYLRTHIGEQMSSELGRDGSFLADPVFEHTFGWEECPKSFEDLKGNLLSNELIETLANAKNYNFKLSSYPYTHQLASWKILLEKEPKSVVITSGTGSGKTECFMVPILEDLIQETKLNNEGLVGVRALFLYPLNALINSQQERLHEWTQPFDKNIRFALYNGKTEQSERKVRKLQKDRPNQILSRELLRKEPPPILMTNSTMLEYMLIRQADSPIMEISKKQKSLRWIILDEAHTYIGSQAAELSLLLRRVVHAFGKSSEEIRFVATSATIAGEGSEKSLQSYLADLAGVSPERVLVLGGARVIPELPIFKPEKSIVLDAIKIVDSNTEISKERFELLSKSPIALNIRDTIVNSKIPKLLSDLVIGLDGLIEGSAVDKQMTVLKWIDVMSGTKDSHISEPFLKLRAHFFQRMLHGLWACIDPACTSKPASLSHLPYGNIYVSQRSTCNCNAPVFEIGFCEECKFPHLLGEDVKGKLQQRSPFSGDEFSLNYEHDEEEILNREVSKTPSEKRVVTRLVSNVEQYDEICIDLETRLVGTLQNGNSKLFSWAYDFEAVCSECGHEGKHGKDFYRKSYLGAPFYVSNAVPTLLEYCPDPSKKECDGKSPEELPGRGRKLITFTDSRQGTARMAVRMQQEAERSRLRGLVFELLRNAESKYQVNQPEESPLSFEKLMNIAKSLETIQPETAKDLRQQAEMLRNSSQLVDDFEMPWNDLVSNLANSKDISQSILDYNKYANPELFSGEEAGFTMAKLLLAREFSRRPKFQNSSETLGVVKVGYAGLNKIENPPKFWCETYVLESGVETKERLLTLQDWKNFIKVALDFFVRENSYIQLDRTLQRWMGARFSPKILFPPNSEIVESSGIKKWPLAKKKGMPHRLVKLLEAAVQVDRNDPVGFDKINLWLESAWKELVNKNILEQFESGFSLNLNTLTFSLPKTAWVCPVSNRLIDTIFCGVTPYLPNKKIKIDIHCKSANLPNYLELKHNGSEIPKLQYLRQLVGDNVEIQNLRSLNNWIDLSDRTIEGGFYYRTAEHSAQQSSSKLEKYETLFKKGKINVLNCSTTMEMGVDIGGITAVVMNNVPPHPANYLQRAGRAGRRSESRAIAYTLCKANPHNQRVFDDPLWAFKTAIPAPSITLSSDRIVQRHVNSLLLSLFLKSLKDSGDDRTKLTMKWFFDGDGSPFSHFKDWLGLLGSDDEIAIKELTKGTNLAGRSTFIIIDQTLIKLNSIGDYWNREYKKLLGQIFHAKEEVYKRALNYELERHEKEYLLKEFASRGFLPGYGFPTDIVNLNTYNIEDFKNRSPKSDKQNREDNIFSMRELPTRGLNIAIREYAPGSQVVIDGRVFRSAGVGLHWHSGGAINEAQKFDLAWRCDKCGQTGVRENAYSNSQDIECTSCQSKISIGEQKLILRPSGFLTDFYEETTNDSSSQKYIRVERPRIQVNGDLVALPDSRCGFMKLGHDGSVFYHSSGENEHGYAICMSCGRAESMTPSNEVPHTLSPNSVHRPVGGVVGSHKEKDCSGEFVKQNINLGYQTETDVLELYFKNPLSGFWLSDCDDDQVIALTLSVAIRDLIASEMGIAPTEMGFGIRLDKDMESKQGRSVVQIYDQISGGAGFVLGGAANISTLLSMIEQKLDCKANCESVCSCCLAASDSRVESDELNRITALNWLKESQYVDFLKLPPIFDPVNGAVYCSSQPTQVIRNRINKGSKSIYFYFPENPSSWNLSSQLFREQVLTWNFIDRQKITLCISDQKQLDSETKFELALLARLGVHIKEFRNLDVVNDLICPVQIETEDKILSVISNDKKCNIPGDNWLISNEEDVWVTSNEVNLADLYEIDVDGWDGVAAGAVVLDIRKELDGPLRSLSNRFRNLIESKIPRLNELIGSDSIANIHYVDRYLNSPWSLMLLEEILSGISTDFEELDLSLVKFNGKQHGKFITHDWSDADDLEKVISLWGKNAFGISPKVKFSDRSFEISHGRIITITWKSGKITKLIFDQGMGYWKPKMPYRDMSEFDFYQDFGGQVQDMEEKGNSALINVPTGTNWPTFITFIEGE